jgi:hypothetical protein
MKHLMAVFALATMTACASAGPVVSNVAYDAGGKLVIEKCKVKSNFFLGTMELTECNTHDLQIQQPVSK